MNKILWGCDVSEFQLQIDFDTVKKNVDFVFIRASFGTSRADKTFVRNRDEARRVKLPRGFYHYAYPQFNTPEDEADFFLQTVGPLQAGEILVLDIEENYPDAVAWCKKFLDHVSASLQGYKPLLYTYDAYIKAHGDWSPIYHADYGLWYANYNGEDPANPTWNTPWPEVPFWQYSDKGQVPGIPATVDLDVLYGDVNVFYAYGYTPIDPCAGIKDQLSEVTKRNDALIAAIVSVGKQLDIFPDPNNTQAASDAFVQAIKNLQDNQQKVAPPEPPKEPDVPMDIPKINLPPVTPTTPPFTVTPGANGSIEVTPLTKANTPVKRHADYFAEGVVNTLKFLRLVK